MDEWLFINKNSAQSCSFIFCKKLSLFINLIRRDGDGLSLSFVRVYKYVLSSVYLRVKSLRRLS